MYQENGNSSNGKDVVKLDELTFDGDVIEVTSKDGRVWASLRRVCENLGIAFSPQRRKLLSSPWATVTIMITDDVRDRKRSIFMIDKRTFYMWLATINLSKVAPEHHEKLTRYQRNVADVIEKYMSGEVISRQPLLPSPALTAQEIEMRVQAIRFEGVMRMVTIAQQNNLASKEFLDRQIEESFARMKGTAYEPKDAMLDVSTFLKRKGVSEKDIRARSGQFGKNLKMRYFEKFGEEPPIGISFVGGRERPVFMYKESHKPIFEAVFLTMFGHDKELMAKNQPKQLETR